MCILISLVFMLIGIVSYFGDYEREELKKDYEKYKEIICGDMERHKKL